MKQGFLMHRTRTLKQLALLLALLLAAPSTLLAQSPAPSSAPPAPSAPTPTPTPAAPRTAASAPAAAPNDPAAFIYAETKAARGRLDGFKAELDQKELTLQSRALPDAGLQDMRLQLTELATKIGEVVDEQTPRLEASRARLNELGPKPAAGQPEESADVARDRAEREAAVAELGETQRLGRALLVQADQLSTQIADRRRTAFTRALFEQSDGLLSPSLWMSVVSAVPRELRAQQTILSDTIGHIQRKASVVRLLLLGLAIGVAVALYAGRKSIAPRLVRRDNTITDPSRRSRLLAALGVLAIGAAPAAAGSWVVWLAIHYTEILPARIEIVATSVLRALAFVAFVRATIDAVTAPDHHSWRLLALQDASANRIMNYGVTIISIVMTGKVLESFNQAIAAALPITVFVRAIFAIVSALLFAAMLRQFARSEDDEADNPATLDFGGPVRSIGWIVCAAIIISTLTGYIALGSFLVDQAIWISILTALLVVMIAIVDEFIGNTLRTHNRIAATLQANTGIRRKSLEQIGVLSSGFLRLALVIVAVLLALAPWGIESTDLAGSVRAAFFGFSVGNFTISLSTILLGAVFFAVGFTLTRVIQKWLDNTFLPSTDLDAGLRNSIRTATGYVGIIATAVVVFSYLGLSLERVTIVAGALSVGIGFGLQSIVNNFISGLILLWERPIRVGDLVVVGDGEGYVRRINVRSTEIQTGDRSTLIVPNSNLISGIVKNRVRNDRIGRVLVSIPVPRAADPEHVSSVMKEAALAHREVMSDPPPRVLFKKVTENTIDFDLICFVDDIDAAGRVSSDLYFAIFKALRATGLGEVKAAPSTPSESEPEPEPRKTDEQEGLTILTDKSHP
jgi:small-conductance mechanosensitive channel